MRHRSLSQFVSWFTRAIVFPDPLTTWSENEAARQTLSPGGRTVVILNLNLGSRRSLRKQPGAHFAGSNTKTKSSVKKLFINIGRLLLACSVSSPHGHGTLAAWLVSAAHHLLDAHLCPSYLLPPPLAELPSLAYLFLTACSAPRMIEVIRLVSHTISLFPGAKQQPDTF
ncbi:hypothetical protein RRG08_038083 [Elysia crispata]|uniref:Uncharacterized protein n=1 Tax=Elysia crispata TaxID=231223 RepID=A0AAE0ZYJ6_9GAST|nr:hypothetical protein RRG08_038083 [Elysia crispata]